MRFSYYKIANRTAPYGVMHCYLQCDTMRSYHFMDNFNAVFTICIVYMVWWTSKSLQKWSLDPLLYTVCNWSRSLKSSITFGHYSRKLQWQLMVVWVTDTGLLTNVAFLGSAQRTNIKVYTNYTIMGPLMGKSCFIDSFCLKIMRFHMQWNKVLYFN